MKPRKMIAIDTMSSNVNNRYGVMCPKVGKWAYGATLKAALQELYDGGSMLSGVLVEAGILNTSLVGLSDYNLNKYFEGRGIVLLPRSVVNKALKEVIEEDV